MRLMPRRTSTSPCSEPACHVEPVEDVGGVPEVLAGRRAATLTPQGPYQAKSTKRDALRVGEVELRSHEWRRRPHRERTSSSPYRRTGALLLRQWIRGQPSATSPHPRPSGAPGEDFLCGGTIRRRRSSPTSGVVPSPRGGVWWRHQTGRPHAYEVSACIDLRHVEQR